MRPIVTAIALSLAMGVCAPLAMAADDAPWKEPGWEPVTESERQPVTAEEIEASAVEVQENRGVRYLTGGLGAGERAWLDQHGSAFPVTLQFSKGARGAFVSAVDVTIRSRNGQIQFEAITDGPLIYIDLPNGSYEATATYREHQRQFELRVPAGGQAVHSVNFP